MANAQTIRGNAGHATDSPLFAPVVVSLFVGILALSAWAPGLVTATIGTVFFTVGLTLAGSLWLVSGRGDRRAKGWDLAAAAVFLGFIAILVSDALPAL